MQRLNGTASGTAIDAEFLAMLMESTRYSMRYVDTGFEGYSWGRGGADAGELATAYMNALSAISQSSRVSHLLDSYPWTTGACMVSTPPWTRIATKLSHLEESSALLAEGDEGEWLSEPLGRIRLGFIPDAAFYERMGWEEAALRLETKIDSDQRFTDYRSAPTLPSQAEAQQLIDAHRNPPSSLTADILWAGFTDLSSIPAGRWETHPFLAPMALSGLYQEWTFAELSCLA